MRVSLQARTGFGDFFPFQSNEFLPPATKLGQGYVFTRVCDSAHSMPCRSPGVGVGGIPACLAAGARSKNSATNHSTFQKKSELLSIGGGHVVPVVNNTTCFSIYKWLLFLLLFSSYFPLLSHSFLK